MDKFSSSDKVVFDDLGSANNDPGAVTSLKLRKQDFTEIPDLSKFKNLTELDLSDNELGDFSNKLSSLTNLQVLNLSGNNLTTIPADICNMKSLKILNLSGNKIASGSLSCINSLERLYLNNNELTAIPSGITEMASLKSLYLHSNKLTSLDEKLLKLTNLEVLFVQFNKIPTEPEAFKNNLILNYIFNPQSTSNKQLYKYINSGTTYSVIPTTQLEPTNGVISSPTSIDGSEVKPLGPWERIKGYAALRGSAGIGTYKQKVDGVFSGSELEAGFPKFSAGAYFGITLTSKKDSPDLIRGGLFYRYYFADLSKRFRPYAKLAAGITYNDDGGITPNVQARAGFDFYVVRFFGLNVETGFGAGNMISFGTIWRLNFKKRG